MNYKLMTAMLVGVILTVSNTMYAYEDEDDFGETRKSRRERNENSRRYGNNRDRGRNEEGRRREHQGEMQSGMHGGRHMQMFMEQLESEYPEKVEELKKLREEDPEAFHDKMRALAKEFREKMKENRKELQELVKSYRKDKSEDVKNKIREKLVSQFDKQLKMEEKRIKRMEEQVKKQKERYQKRKSKSEEIIDNKLDDLLADPDVKW